MPYFFFYIIIIYTFVPDNLLREQVFTPYKCKKQHTYIVSQ